MSDWAQIDAHFHIDPPAPRARLAGQILKDIEERDPGMPTGSEDGPSVHDLKSSRAVWVQGNLRDFVDGADAALVLAWFTRLCRGSETYLAYCTLTLGEGGPRYRWEWKQGELLWLKGELEC